MLKCKCFGCEKWVVMGERSCICVRLFNWKYFILVGFFDIIDFFGGIKYGYKNDRLFCKNEYICRNYYYLVK